MAVAKLLAAIVQKESPQLAILGKQAIDDDANQVGQMLAALLTGHKRRSRQRSNRRGRRDRQA